MDGLVSGLVGISEQALFIKDLFDFYDTVPTIYSRPEALPAPGPIRDGFELSHVSFHYAGSDRNVLDDVSVRFYPGERTAPIYATTMLKLYVKKSA